MNPADTRGQDPGGDPRRELLRISARRTRRSFLIMAAAAGGGYWLYDRLGGSRQIGMLQWPLRRSEEYNAALFKKIFRERGLAPTYSLSQATDLRLNGDIGLDSDLNPGLDLDTWRLKLAGADHAERYRQYSEDMNLWAYLPNEGAVQQPVQQAPTELPPLDTKEPAAKLKGCPKAMLPQQLTATAVRSNGTGPIQLSETQTITITASAGSPSEMPGLLLSMDDLRRLPHRELVTQFKCIEGWSQIVQWGGVRLADFINAYPPARTPEGRRPRYIYMETPDGEYFCGFDMAACMHPQSLLVYEMGGQALTPGHGAPLRLAMPIKYGYKQIKQIGLIRYTDTRPNDYWANFGYDWYAGL
jgi:Oxidoreductase molybdopterin binding domain